MKAYKRVYPIVMVLMLVVTALFGTLCFHYDYLPEGIIVIGVVLMVSTVTLIMCVAQSKAEPEMILEKAGTNLGDFSCICHVDNAKSDECIMYMRSMGVVFDTAGVEFGVIIYEDVKILSSNNSTLCLKIRDAGNKTKILKMVSSKPLKIKAVKQTLIQHGSKILGQR